jgi:hypothetical protein
MGEFMLEDKAPFIRGVATWLLANVPIFPR